MKMPATLTWKGGATNEIAQIDHATPGGTIEADDVFNMTLTGEDGQTDLITYTGDTTVKLISEGLVAAAVAAALDSDNLWSNVTATEDDTKVIITANEAGIPFHLTIETTELGGGAADDQTFVQTVGTANSGPNDVGTAENWDDNTVPVTGDTVIILDSSHDIKYSLKQNLVLLAALHVDIRSKRSQFIGEPGKYLYYDADVVTYHSVGRSWLRIDNMTADMNITATGKSGTDGTYGLNLLGSNAGTDIFATLGNGQTFGLAARIGEVCTFVQLFVVSGTTYVGDSTGLTHIQADGGAIVVTKEDLDTLLKIYDATVTVQEGTPAIIDMRGGVCYLNAPGTLPQVNLYDLAILDMTKNQRPRTISACHIFSESVQIKDPNGTVTWSAGFNCNGCKLPQIDLPANMNFPAPTAL